MNELIMTNYKCLIEFYNNNNSKYSIKSNIHISRLQKDEDNIKLAFPTKEDHIYFEFDTMEEDIFINLEIDNIDKINISNKNDFRLNQTVDKYKRRLAYKIKWDLKKNKKKILIKAIIINRQNNSYLFNLFEKYAVIN
jgi:hypothetical protein